MYAIPEKRAALETPVYALPEKKEQKELVYASLTLHDEKALAKGRAAKPPPSPLPEHINVETPTIYSTIAATTRYWKQNIQTQLLFPCLCYQSQLLG